MSIENTILRIMERHLDTKTYKVFLFGSRAGKDHAKWSDFDIGIEGKAPVPLEKIEDIRGDLEDSDLPYFIDVVDFQRVGDEFKKVALRNMKELR